MDSDSRVASYSEHIDAISSGFRELGALALIVIDAAELGDVERRFGVAAHRHAVRELRRLVEEATHGELGEQDLIVRSGAGVDELVVFLFRARGDHGFYREELARIAGNLAQKISQAGNRIVYPYRRDTPDLPVGQAFALYNPGLREARQVRETLERARADAALNASILDRERTKAFEDIVLAEDVTMLYEPILNLTTRDIIGYEGLVRGPWDSDLHTPGALFQMAEKTGLVYELDCLCRRQALRGARGLTPGKLLFLNCLPTAIHDPAFRGDVLRKTLEELRLRPSDVVFEISERESIANFAIFREARDYYRELGFKVALDDTGVAYGSLEAVMELSPDFIKADLSLVRGIDSDRPRQELLRALNSVAGTIHASIIAEGIETSEELSTVHDLGIAYGQGYLFGRPAPLRRAV
ncbi:MAG: EAL domain-containing protein [Deltaproteobacteria bacterium]|nr:EAL domain-containing protein [Deltaproteobacteria bacterium]